MWFLSNHFGTIHYTVGELFPHHSSLASNEKKIHLWQIWTSLSQSFPFACGKRALKGLHQRGVCWASFLVLPPGRWQEEHLSAAGQGLRPFPQRPNICLQESCPEDGAVSAAVVGCPRSYLEQVVWPFLLHLTPYANTYTCRTSGKLKLGKLLLYSHIWVPKIWSDLPEGLSHVRCYWAVPEAGNAFTMLSRCPGGPFHHAWRWLRVGEQMLCHGHPWCSPGRGGLLPSHDAGGRGAEQRENPSGSLAG